MIVNGGLYQRGLSYVNSSSPGLSTGMLQIWRFKIAHCIVTTSSCSGNHDESFFCPHFINPYTFYINEPHHLFLHSQMFTLLYVLFQSRRVTDTEAQKNNRQKRNPKKEKRKKKEEKKSRKEKKIRVTAYWLMRCNLFWSMQCALRVVFPIVNTVVY